MLIVYFQEVTTFSVRRKVLNDKTCIHSARMTDRCVSDIYKEWYNRRNGVLRALTTEYAKRPFLISPLLSSFPASNPSLIVARLIVKVSVSMETSMELGKWVLPLTRYHQSSRSLAMESTALGTVSMYVIQSILHAESCDGWLEASMACFCCSAFRELAVSSRVLQVDLSVLETKAKIRTPVFMKCTVI